MKTAKLYAAGTATIVGISLACCASAQIRTGQTFTVSYGTVDRIDMVKVGNDGQPTGAGTGAVIGGLAGSVNASHAHRARDAAAGALVGALLTAAVNQHRNKDNMAYQYTVDLLNGGAVSVVVEHGDIEEGDCVAVEQGPTANIRRVSQVHCANSGHEALQSPEVAVKRDEAAADCHAAKELALRARSESEIDVALKKVRVFCES